MRLTLTGQLALIVADHACAYGVSPGKTGEAVPTDGEMSQILRIASVCPCLAVAGSTGSSNPCVNLGGGSCVLEELYETTVSPHLQEIVMELQEARAIVNALAQGVHPVTGEVMPEDSPYNAPPVIRALVTVSQALDSLQGRPR